MLLIGLGLQVIRKSSSDDVRVLTTFMIGGLAAFAVDGMFGFPTERIEHCLYLVFVAGIILGLYTNHLVKEKGSTIFINKWFLIPMIIVVISNIFIGSEKYKFEKHSRLAKNYRNEKQYIKVLSEVEAGKSRLIKLDPSGEPLEMQSSAAYIELQDWNKALEEIHVAVSYRPNSSRIWTIMGVVYGRTKQYGTAIYCYQRALHFTPNYDLAFKNLAFAYFASEKYVECIETVNRISINEKGSLKYLSDRALEKLHHLNK